MNIGGYEDLLAKLIASVQQQATRKKGGISVSFSYRYDTLDDEDDEDNKSPYIQLSDPDESINGQLEPKEIVINKPLIRIVFDYPLIQPVTYTYHADTENGFTRTHLARCVVAGYNRIYTEENDFVEKQKREAKFCDCYVWRMVSKRNMYDKVFPREIIELINEHCINNPIKRPRKVPMLNRETTTGPHGIWGHSLEDLVLHTVEQVEDDLFALGVDS